MEIVGSRQVRPDAWEKVSGQTRYLADMPVADSWFGGTLRSPVPHGRLLGIHRDPSFDWSRVCVVTADDLPGPNVVAMIADDHPILASTEVRFLGEPVALVAAPEPKLLRAALAALRPEIEEQPAILELTAGLQQPLLAEYRIVCGDLEAAWECADRVIAGTYQTGHQEHLYLEPNGVIATPRENGGIEILGSMQCPYYVQRALAVGLKMPADAVIVRQAATGGAFGGKEDYPSILALHAALLARRSGRPVRMVLERTEDIRATTKRHPSRVRHRTGVTREGELVAAEIDVVLDGGAYTTLSPVVLSRAILHAAGPYRLPSARIHGRVVMTHTPPSGAFRGFGAPQVQFAAERHMDRIARELEMSPLDIRRRNLLRDGDQLPFGQRLPEGGSGAAAVLEHAVRHAQYVERRAACAQANQRDPHRRRGIGLSLYFHGGGFTGAGEERIAAKVGVRFAPEGVVEILTSNVEMGQGASTVLCMIAGQALGIDPVHVRHVMPDTSVVPDSGPTVASRTTMIVGKILVAACRRMAAQLPSGRFMETARRWVAAGKELAGEAEYTPPEGQHWDEENYQGDAYKAYSWGADVVEIEIDPATMEVRPRHAYAVVEIGRAIHPVLVAGQVEGGTLQSLGYGYLEELKVRDGRFLNDRMATYIVATAMDAPVFEVGIEELPFPGGPYGAKGVGELPFNGGAPALVAAIDQATGQFVTRIPATPERLLRTEADADGCGDTD